tara:strand:- start:287 stop:460 length:174 start_codon:yes stop_codon:yes gene_type:complete
MKYHLYDENHIHQGTFDSLEKLRNFLCERKYDNDDRTYMADTFDHIKEIKWHWDITE